MLVVMRAIAIVIVIGLLGYVLVAAAINGVDADWRALLLVASIPIGIGLHFWEFFHIAKEVRERPGSGAYPGPSVEQGTSDDDHRRQL